MRIVAIIPARGGSVGIPGKNIRPLNGIPLLGRSINAVRQAEYACEIYVTSDDPAVLDIATKFGAKGVIRPRHLAGSTASSESALLHALAQIEADDPGNSADIVVFIQCTSPFLTSNDIDKVVSALIEKEADSALAVIPDHGFYWEHDPDRPGYARCLSHNKAQRRPRRQELKPRYRETGAIYAMRAISFRRSGNRFCGKTILVEVDMPPLEIDTPEDWRLAEALAKSLDARLPPRNSHHIRALVMDFDGVHTDDRVIVLEDGSEAVRCSRSDGMGLEMLRNAGVALLILSRESNSVVAARASKLKAEVKHHVLAKLPTLDQWREKMGLEWSHIAYIGNDVNDVECMSAAGLATCPADASEKVKPFADFILKSNGGNGALREFSELLISYQWIE